MRRGQAHTHPSTHDDSGQHRDKRQFQPSVTSFFAPEQHDSSDSDEDLRGSGPTTRQQQHHLAKQQQQQQQRDSVVPRVPGSVQADLLSVGMRVRKSVPEGYKTHKTASLPSTQTTLAIAPNGRASATSTMTTTECSIKPPRDVVPDEFQHQRELLPFSGLQKVGGYAEQPVTNVHLYGGTSASGERALNLFPLPAEAFTQPFSSHSSTDSTVSTSSLRPNPTNPYKRSWQDEADRPMKLNTEFHFKIPVKVSEDEVPVSPLSETPPMSLSSAFPQAALRPFAQPKTRRARVVEADGTVLKESDIEMDVENAEQQAQVIVGNVSDFDEADFLMGGV